MRLFLAYIKQKKKNIILAAVCGLIFFICFSLYHLPMKAVLYPTGLCALVCLAFAIKDFSDARKKYQTLQVLRRSSDMIAEHLPQMESMEEEAYQQIIHQICDKQMDLQTAMNQRYTDMVDYYTVWAHQIKTPIASMRLHLQNEDSQISRKLSADLFRIEQYVEMVLMFLRLDSETTDYVIKEYDLDQIVRPAVKKFSGEFISRKIGLSYEKLECVVITDEKWLSFVIEQILSNALKYTPSGTISIYIEEPKILCVRDTGIGIAPEDLPRIFEKGYTGYNGRTDKKASGIGLYLCKCICRNLGHRISATSEIDNGTIIRIDLNQRKLEVE